MQILFIPSKRKFDISKRKVQSPTLNDASCGGALCKFLMVVDLVRGRLSHGAHERTGSS